MTISDAEFGCSAFGHLASPFADGELARDEREGFATHLDTCRPCQKVVAAYRALDVLAKQGPTAVPAADWDRAWVGITAAIATDREAAAAAPLASVTRLSSRLREGRRTWMRPLGYIAAAAVLVALTLSLQRRWDIPTPLDRQPVTAQSIAVGASNRTATNATGASPEVRPVSAPSKLIALTCLAPDFVPVVYTVDGEEPMTVVQCAHVGPLAEASGPTQG